jgi:hypothetical protein
MFSHAGGMLWYSHGEHPGQERSEKLHNRLRRYAREQHCTLSDIVLEAIEREIGQREWHKRFSRRSKTHHAVLVREAWQYRHNVSAYDAFYVAAARLSNASLLTTDGPLSRAPSLGIVVENVRLS